MSPLIFSPSRVSMELQVMSSKSYHLTSHLKMSQLKILNYNSFMCFETL